MRMKYKEFVDKDVYAGNEKIGKIKEIGIDPENWKVTHLARAQSFRRLSGKSPTPKQQKRIGMEFSDQ